MPTRPLPIIAAMGVAAVVFALNLAFPAEAALGVLYLVAVWLAGRGRRPQAVLAVAGLCTALAVAAVAASPPDPREAHPVLLDFAFALLAVWVGAGMTVEWLKVERARDLLRKSADESSRRRAEELETTSRRLNTEMAERRQGEAARARLADILERGPDCVALVRVDGRLAYLNQAGRRLLGIEPKREVGHFDFRDFQPERLREKFARQMLPAARREGVWQGEFSLRPRGGGEVPVAMVVLAHYDEKGAVEYWALVAHDVSYQREAQRALRESEGRLRAIFEAAMDCIITVDDKGRIVEFNRAAEKTFRGTRGSVMGKEMAELFLPLASRQRYRRNLEHYQALGEGSMLGKRLELTMNRADGESFVAQIAIQPVALKGEPVFTLFLQDITERKRAEQVIARRTEELARSNADLAQFAYVASHDLLEPLRAVSSHCQMLQLKYQGQLDEAADEHIGFAVNGATRMQRLIHDLLSYSRVGTQGEPFEPVCSRRMVNEALQNLETAIQESGARIECGDLPTVVGDRRQLPQLFQNLIGNAIKYRGSEPPRIEIAARRRSRDWLFSIRDNGIGIEPRHAERIFVIFKRLHGRNQYGGTGIGLAICKKIVECHGGKIWVEPAPRQGSQFHFTLPAKAKGAAS
jgi:PAS domain S-box-containing protein